MTAYTAADVAALTSVTCRTQHGLGAPQQPCYGCRSDAARLLDAVASGIAARTLRETADKFAVTILDALGYRVSAVFLEDLLDRADEIERAS